MLHRHLSLALVLSLSACGGSSSLLGSPIANVVGVNPLTSMVHERPTPELPDVTRIPLRSIAGDDTNLAKMLGHRPAVVILWAPWCESCKREIPSILRLDRKARERGDFVVVGIAIGDEPENVQGFASAHRLSYPQLIDTQGDVGLLGRRQVPTTLVINRQGRTVYMGEALDEAAIDALNNVLRR